MLRKHRVIASIFAAALAMGPPIAWANCEPGSGYHGGTAFLAPLEGTWRVSGEVQGRRLAGTADGVMDGDVLALVFHPAEAGAGNRTARVFLHYDARCDDFTAALHMRLSPDRQADENGRGVARGNALDLVFPAPSGGHRSDATMSWDQRHAVWTVRLAREVSAGSWERFGALRLEQTTR